MIKDLPIERGCLGDMQLVENGINALKVVRPEHLVAPGLDRGASYTSSEFASAKRQEAFKPGKLFPPTLGILECAQINGVLTFEPRPDLPAGVQPLGARGGQLVTCLHT
ncbi:hypothetical protein [Ruegeria sp. SCP11]|uniref:hypothetical protein n=1 Tax=Ruegeria sp. SCP11 TaxID=3141378 RepID=UPI003338BA9A